MISIKTVFADRRLSRLISFYPVGRLLFRMSILSKRLFLLAGSWSQRAIEYPWVLKHLPRRPDALVLDVGCSESLISDELVARGYQVIGIDIQKYPWKTHQMSFYQTNVLDTKFPPNLFDIILLVSTIEHIGMNAYGQLTLDQNGDLKAMAELRRILKSGGTLLLITPYIGKGPIKITSTERRYDRDRLNKLIDNLCHPLIQENPGFILIDSLLHGLVEQNPPQTARKFIQYNLPKLIEALKRETQE